MDLVQNRRKEIYGDKNPEIEEEKLTSNLNSLISKKNLSLENQSGLEKSVTELSTKKESLEKNITEKTTTLDAELKSFSLLLERNDFTSELNYLEARLEPSKKDELLSLETEIENTLKELQIKKNDRASSISLEKEKTLTDLSMDELLSNQKIDLEASESLTEQVALEKARLEENSKALSRLGEKQGLITRQKKECEKWSKLHSLIGSADGKKYRKYAQGLTFEIMVSHANKQLQKMTDRYLLIRDEKEPLSLNIMDNYQAGEIRSTKNLSGGESFIISLTLALGLSKMASKNVKVDSLFLDEGFGTLDEDSLEMALDTLSSLQEDGKLIGVISHISSLKERITTQIKVSPVGEVKAL